MRRKDRETSREDALQAVDGCIYATIAMVNEDGTPYCTPVSIAREGDTLYFHGADEGQKIDILRKNPNVSLSCVLHAENMKDQLSVKYFSANVQGTAREVSDEKEQLRALHLITERHVPTAMDQFAEELRIYGAHTSVWAVNIQEVTGKRANF